MPVRPCPLLAAVALATAAATSSSSAASSIYDSPSTSPPRTDDLASTIRECDRSLSCAGISLEPNGTVAKSRLYRHSFVGTMGTERTYGTRKEYTYHRGRIAGGEVLGVAKNVKLEDAKDRCRRDAQCVGFTYPVRSLTKLDRLTNVTFVSTLEDFMPLSNDEWRTYVVNDPDRVGRIAGDALPYDPDVTDRPYRGCCDRTDVPDMAEVRKVDTLERISCDISREEFFLKYEVPRRPVMLVGCEKDWPAAIENKWIPQKLAPRFDNETRWRARIGGEGRFLSNEDYKDNVRWGDIAEAMLTGKPYYLFDQLYDPAAKSIDEEYSDPGPVKDGDLYRKLPHFNGPLRWFSVGPKYTGTKVHMDPYATDAWNTLLKGHKWWLIYPDGYDDEDQLSCEPSCSVKVPLTVHWYASVGINAARTECPAGERQGGSDGIDRGGLEGPERNYARHVLQGPGETIYIPDGLMHSVFNYDETVAVTKNYASAANLDLVWMETVTSGDPRKWRAMYYRTLNSEQRRRVRESRYWPPQRYEKREKKCLSDEEDLMEEFPMYGFEEEWEPDEGELVEALFNGDVKNGEWHSALVTNVRNDGRLYDLLYHDGDRNRGLPLRFLRRLPRTGDVVEAQYRGSHNEWYMATVINATLDGRYDVMYVDDDEKDLALPRVAVREYYEPDVHEIMQAKFINDEGNVLWVDCVVTDSHGDGTYEVRHFDGEIADSIPMENLRRSRLDFEKREEVIVNVHDEDLGKSRWWRGRISNVRKNGRYDVKYPDGDNDSCISWRSIRYGWADDIMVGGRGQLEADDGQE